MAKGRIELDADTTKLRTGLSRAQAYVSNFAKGAAASFAGVFAVGSVVSGLRDMVEELSRIQDLSARGFSTDFLQDLSAASRLAGTDLETSVRAFSRLAAEINSASGPSLQLQTSLRALGFSADELRGKSPEQIFRLIAPAIGNVRDESQQLAAVTDILGAKFADLIPLLQQVAREGMPDVAKASAENVAKIEEFGDALDKVAMQGRMVLIPVLTMAADRFEGLLRFSSAVVENLKGLAAAFSGMGRVASETYAIMKAGGRGGFISFEDIGKQIGKLTDVWGKFFDNWAKQAKTAAQGVASAITFGLVPPPAAAPAAVAEQPEPAAAPAAGPDGTYVPRLDEFEARQKAVAERMAQLAKGSMQAMELEDEARQEADAEAERARKEAEDKRRRELEDQARALESRGGSLSLDRSRLTDAFFNPAAARVENIQRVGGGGAIGDRNADQVKRKLDSIDAELKFIAETLADIRDKGGML